MRQHDLPLGNEIFTLRKNGLNAPNMAQRAHKFSVVFPPDLPMMLDYVNNPKYETHKQKHTESEDITPYHQNLVDQRNTQHPSN